MAYLAPESDPCSAFCDRYKPRRKLEAKIRQNLAQGEIPRGMGYFYPKTFSYSAPILGLMIGVYVFNAFASYLGVSEIQALGILIPVMALMLFLVFRGRRVILVTDHRLLFIGPGRKGLPRDVAIQSVNSAAMKGSTLKLEIDGRKESWVVDNYSSLAWKKSRRQEFVEAIHQLR
ncbi:MAG TPA: hypothetical protein PKX36_00185 [Candidatus Cloacimonadota bacterium]|nr:hypothetical protein [Candidatus Cloacimonadota bacterium]